MSAAGTGELEREAGRVADRLRVLGPRWATRAADPDAGRAREAVGAALQRLADSAADAEGRARRPVPDLAPHALADQVLVLAHDVLASGDEAAVRSAAATLEQLRRAL